MLESYQGYEALRTLSGNVLDNTVSQSTDPHHPMVHEAL